MRFISLRPLLSRLALVPRAVVSGLGWPVRAVFRRNGSRSSDSGATYAWRDALLEESETLLETPPQDSQEPLQPQEAQPEEIYAQVFEDEQASESSHGSSSGVKSRLAGLMRFVLRRKEPEHSSAFSWRDIAPDESGDAFIEEAYEGGSEDSSRRKPFSGIWSSIASGLARAGRFVLRRKEPEYSSAFAWQDVMPDGTVRRNPERERGLAPDESSRWPALHRFTYSAKKSWARLVRFVLRRDAPLEDEEFLRAEGFFDVDAQWSSLTTPPKDDRWWSPKSLMRTVNNVVRRRTMTITVEDGVVRVVVFQGTKAIAWGTANPEEDFSSPDLDMGALADGYAFRLHALLKELKFGRIRLVTELPLYMPLLRQIQLPSMKRRYFDPIVLAELLDTTPFAEEEVDIKWQHRKNELGYEVFAATFPKRVVDSHIRTLKRGNIRPSATYSRAIALAFASGVPEVIVVHLTPSEAAIVLARDGRAEVVHKTSLTGWEEAPARLAKDIAKAIEQVVGQASTLDVKESDLAYIPVVLTGQLASETALTGALERIIQREILGFGPPLDYPEHFPPAEYAANIGLALADRSRGRTGEKLSKKNAPSVNLLSERHLPRPFPIRPIAAFVAILLFGVVAINVATQVETVILDASALNNRVENLERQARLHRLSIGRARALEQNVDVVEQFAASLESQLGEFEADTNSLLAKLEAITLESLPPNVRVTVLSMSGDEFGFSGKASSYDDVLQFTKNLREIDPEIFSVVKILRLTSADGAELVDEDSEARKGSVSFEITATAFSPPEVDDEDDEEESDKTDDST
ncbi:MAG: hypothetical protein IIC22_00250 [Chloroflexi bacterium]|nr:hypothetical protein [Chloroflexota bacterium]